MPAHYLQGCLLTTPILLNSKNNARKKMQKKRNNYQAKKTYHSYGLEIQKGYDLHHIDLNCENNHILNLIAIPRKLHQKYHQLRKPDYEIVFKLPTKMSSSYQQFVIEEYLQYCKEYSSILKVFTSLLEKRDSIIMEKIDLLEYINYKRI